MTYFVANVGYSDTKIRTCPVQTDLGSGNHMMPYLIRITMCPPFTAQKFHDHLLAHLHLHTIRINADHLASRMRALKSWGKAGLKILTRVSSPGSRDDPQKKQVMLFL